MIIYYILHLLFIIQWKKKNFRKDFHFVLSVTVALKKKASGGEGRELSHTIALDGGNFKGFL